MPLPDGGNTPWPPHHCDHVYRRIASWSAWYSGDPDQLSAVYGGTVAADSTGFFASERGGFRAVINRTLNRWFWGHRQTPTEQRTKLHVPIAGDIAAASADLLFSEPPKITAQDTAAQERIEQLIDDGVHAVLLEGAEISAALGGVYLRVVWDQTMSDRPWLTVIHPDAAIPVFKWGKLTEVTFWKAIHDDGTSVVRHLEHHMAGVISHGVYEGDREHLGYPRPLTDYEDTEDLAGLVNANSQIFTGISKLAAGYVPNMRPNRIWRNQPEAAYLGRSDYAGVEPLMDSLDETYSSWMRDLRLAKARLMVPNIFLESFGRGEGARFDTEQELFVGMQGALPSDGMGSNIEQVQFQIRVDEHSRTSQDIMARIVSSAGYSAQTFGLADSVSVTATEVAAKERRSLITRDRKACYWRPELADIIETLLMVDASIFKSGVTPEVPLVEFADVVSQDPESAARTLQLLDTARAVSTKTKVMMLHPDWEEPAIDEEVDLIDGPDLQDPGMELGPPSQTGEMSSQPSGQPQSSNGRVAAYGG